MTEDQLEQDALGWLAEVGYTPMWGPDLAPDGSQPERKNYQQVFLAEGLQAAVARLNPDLTMVARDNAVQQVLDLGIPSLLSANRRLHQLLVSGVPVEVQRDGETRGEFARLIDWGEPSNNEWLAINQFSVKGPSHTRRPDIVLFVNGLPLVVIELKNPADANANIWKAFEQLQTYKAQIPDLFLYNEILVTQLEIKNLHVSIEDKEILKGLSLTINQGEIHAIMGPNGTGKSTLAYTLMGHPN